MEYFRFMLLCGVAAGLKPEPTLCLNHVFNDHELQLLEGLHWKISLVWPNECIKSQFNILFIPSYSHRCVLMGMISLLHCKQQDILLYCFRHSWVWSEVERLRFCTQDATHTSSVEYTSHSLLPVGRGYRGLWAWIGSTAESRNRQTSCAMIAATTTVRNI